LQFRFGWFWTSMTASVRLLALACTTLQDCGAWGTLHTVMETYVRWCGGVQEEVREAWVTPTLWRLGSLPPDTSAENKLMALRLC
jgi:hypothetical protein